ncbi:MAG: hypothetical protein IPF42_08165 [Candidatus Microthrix sp.]|nr:hypothetical protein [Candidatus Microthrix sp.]
MRWWDGTAWTTHVGGPSWQAGGCGGCAQGWITRTSRGALTLRAIARWGWWPT